jgi:NAD-dependent SIR2 family protein deacetylase
MECERITNGHKCAKCESNMVRINTQVIIPEHNPPAIIGEACIQESLVLDMCVQCGTTHEVHKTDNFDMVQVTLSMFYYNIELLNKRAAHK